MSMYGKSEKMGKRQADKEKFLKELKNWSKK